MANYSVQITSYATNATIITGLSRCDQIVNLTQTIQNLYNLYKNNLSNPISNVFSNLSIINFNCTTSSGKYFEQIITFINSVSIHVQIQFASIYYDYIYANQYSLNGFYIEPDQRFNLSSITLNYLGQSDACSSANIAHDPLCLLNSSTPICVTCFSNPWIYNCSENISTSTISPWLTTNNDQSLSNISSGILNPWQIGLICGFSVLFLLIILLALGYFIRRRSRTKFITISRENLVTNTKSMQNSGIPQIQVIHQAPIIVQSRQTQITPITRFYHGNNKGYIMNRKPPKPSNTLSSTRPVSGTSTKQLRSITDGLEEDKLDESDDISMNPIKPSTPITNMSSIDESLHDEDAWMSILAVVNAELDVLNRLESEQNRLKTTM